jgi:hypothetical protein
VPSQAAPQARTLLAVVPQPAGEPAAGEPAVSDQAIGEQAVAESL